MAADKKKSVLSDNSRPSMKEEKEKALASAMGQIDKQFGKGTIMRLGDGSGLNVETISSGSLTLDIALGGGLPIGRIVEIYGPESSGKTTVALSAIASAQKQGLQCAFIDAEHALEITDALVRSGAVNIIVVDSVAALTPKAEIKGEIGDSHMGLHARMMSQAMRKLKGNINTSKSIVIFINQIRMKIGVMFGNPETTTGGNALKFYASVRMDVRRIGAVKNKETEVIGSETRVKVVKNKVAPPFRQAEFRIMYGEGISHADEVVTLAEGCKIITKAGAWYSYGNERLGQGRDKTIEWLKENPELLADIEQQVREKYLQSDNPLPLSSGKRAVTADGEELPDDVEQDN